MKSSDQHAAELENEKHVQQSHRAAAVAACSTYPPYDNTMRIRNTRVESGPTAMKQQLASIIPFTTGVYLSKDASSSLLWRFSDVDNDERRLFAMPAADNRPHRTDKRVDDLDDF